MSPDQETDSVLVDTCVVSFLEKGDTRAKDYVPHLEGKNLVLSFMTVAELERWALARRWGKVRRRRMEQLLQDNYVIYSEMSGDLCRTWAEVSNQRSRKGHEIGCADA